MSVLIARRQVILSSLTMALAALLPAPVLAQARKLGDRPIKIIVPFAPGGGVDVFARLLSDKHNTNWSSCLVDASGA